MEFFRGSLEPRAILDSACDENRDREYRSVATRLRLSSRQKPGDDEQCDACPHCSVSASQQPSHATWIEPEPARDRVRADGREDSTENRDGDDVRALADLPEPFRNHAAVSLRSVSWPESVTGSGPRMPRWRRRTRSPHHRRARTFASRADEIGKPAQPRRAIASTNSLCTAPPPPKLFIASSWRISSASRLYS